MKNDSNILLMIKEYCLGPFNGFKYCTNRIIKISFPDISTRGLKDDLTSCIKPRQSRDYNDLYKGLKGYNYE
jgi:hypothetical protein